MLGVFGDPEVTGKPAGDDLREGKRTVLIAQVGRLGTPQQQDVVRAHLGDPTMTESGVEAIRSVLVDSGALAAVEEMIEDRADQARAALVDLALAPPAREGIGAVAVRAQYRAQESERPAQRSYGRDVGEAQSEICGGHPHIQPSMIDNEMDRGTRNLGRLKGLRRRGPRRVSGGSRRSSRPCRTKDGN